MRPSNKHFYDIEGNKRYDADLRTAKKEKLLPSITTIIGDMCGNSGFEYLDHKNIVESIYNNSLTDDETRHEYINKIINEADYNKQQAQLFGTNMHEYIDSHIKEIPFDIEDNDRYLSKFNQLIREIYMDGGYSETVMISKKYGFGGTIDFHNESKIIDWKTQNVKFKEFKRPNGSYYEIKVDENKFIRPVPSYKKEMLIQLCGCKILLKENGKEVDHLQNVIINSNPFSDNIFTKEYTQEEILWGEMTFLSLVKAYRLYNKF